MENELKEIKIEFEAEQEQAKLSGETECLFEGTDYEKIISAPNYKPVDVNIDLFPRFLQSRYLKNNFAC